jgi:hypothetical protein
LDPTLAAQARLLGMLSQVVMQLEHHVRSKDLSAIHDEDMILGATASELLVRADSIAPNQTADFSFRFMRCGPASFAFSLKCRLKGIHDLFPSAFRSRLERAIRFEDRLIKHPRFIFAQTMVLNPCRLRPGYTTAVAER